MDWLLHEKFMNPKNNFPKLYLEPLAPRKAYFDGRVKCTKMLYTCEGSEFYLYMDITSMYPFGFKLESPHEHNFVPFEQIFGPQK